MKHDNTNTIIYSSTYTYTMGTDNPHISFHIEQSHDARMFLFFLMIRSVGALKGVLFR